MIRYAILALAALCSLATTTRAGFIITFVQDGGGNVDATGSGTINTAALTAEGSAVWYIAVRGTNAYVGLGPTPQGSIDVSAYSGITGPANLGSGSAVFATVGSGDGVGLNYNSPGLPILFVPLSYVSGASLSDNATWTGQTFSSLGLTPGTYTWTWGSGPTEDSFEVIIGVPEPSSMILLGLAVGGIGFGAWMRRRRGAVETAT